MKVRFKETIAGMDFVFGAGEVDLPLAEAEYWISKGIAEKVKEEKEPVQRPLKVQEVKAKTRPIRRRIKK